VWGQGSSRAQAVGPAWLSPSLGIVYTETCSHMATHYKLYTWWEKGMVDKMHYVRRVLVCAPSGDLGVRVRFCEVPVTHSSVTLVCGDSS
jgi:hypothetical protein